MNRKVFSVVCCLSAVGFAFGMERLPLVEKGVAKACVVVPSDAPKCVQVAAAELSHWTKELTGVGLSVGPAAVPGLVPVTYALGPTKGVKYDGFSIVVGDKGVVVSAEDPYGIVYSTYWMMNRFGKVYWFDPESGVDLEKTDTFALPVGTHARTPLPNRNPLHAGLPDPPSVAGLVADWNAHNGFQPHRHYGSGEKWGLIPHRGNGGHILGDWVTLQPTDEAEIEAEYKRLKETGDASKQLNPPHDTNDRMIRTLARFNVNVRHHPEMFPLIDGKRCPAGQPLRWSYKGKTGNPCLSSPSTRELILRTITADRAKAAKNGRIKYEFGIMDDDVSQWCECDECMKLMKSKGSSSDDDRASDYWWDFCNWLTPKLLEDPDTTVNTAIYLNYRQMPKKVKPMVFDVTRQSVLICPHQRCYLHPLAGEGACKMNARFEKMFREWIDVGMPVRTFEYHCQLPGKGNYAFFEKSWVQDLKWYRAHDVTFSDGGIWGVWGGYPHVPHLAKNSMYIHGAKARWHYIYLTGHFAWDTDDDFETVRRDVLTRYYRAAAPEMLAYHKLLEDAIFDVNICMNYGSSGLPFTLASTKPGLLDKAKAFLSAADKKASGDPELQKRLARDRKMLALDWEGPAALAGSVKARRLATATDAIRLDGVLDEATWKDATVSDDWRWAKSYNVDAQAPSPFSPHTKMLLAHDNDNLYLAFVCDLDPENPDVDKPPTGKTFDAMDGSHLEINVQSPAQNGEYYQLALSRNGKTYSAWTSTPSDRDLKRKCNFTYGISHGKTRWTAELALPLKDFGALPKEGEVWRVSAMRETPKALGTSTGFPFHWMDRWEAFSFGQPGNMVQNASFEQGRPAPKGGTKGTLDGNNWKFRQDEAPAAWTYHQNGGDLDWCEGDAAEGRRFLRIRPIHSWGGPEFIETKPFAVYPKDVASFKVTFAARGEGEIQLYNFVAKKMAPGKVKLDSPTTWKRYEAVVPANGEHPYNFVFRLISPTCAPIDLDDVCIVPNLDM